MRELSRVQSGRISGIQLPDPLDLTHLLHWIVFLSLFDSVSSTYLPCGRFAAGRVICPLIAESEFVKSFFPLISKMENCTLSEMPDNMIFISSFMGFVSKRTSQLPVPFNFNVITGLNADLPSMSTDNNR